MRGRMDALRTPVVANVSSGALCCSCQPVPALLLEHVRAVQLLATLKPPARRRARLRRLAAAQSRCACKPPAAAPADADLQSPSPSLIFTHLHVAACLAHHPHRGALHRIAIQCTDHEGRISSAAARLRLHGLGSGS